MFLSSDCTSFQLELMSPVNCARPVVEWKAVHRDCQMSVIIPLPWNNIQCGEKTRAPIPHGRGDLFIPFWSIVWKPTRLSVASGPGLQ